VKFRRADENDLFELLRIEEECFGRERFSTDIVRAFIVRADAFTVVAEDEGAERLVGSASCLVSETAGEGRIASVAVLNERRAEGIGSGLLVECENVLATFRLRKYVLEVETTNIPAIVMYTHHGYEIVDTLIDYYGLGRDAYSMEKGLSRQKRRLTVR
jgi:ribosomal-protein-alanine N-acetyltransferase